MHSIFQQIHLIILYAKQNNIQLKDNSTLDFGFFEEKKENSISNKEGFLQIELVIDKLKGILESEKIGKCGQTSNLMRIF